MSATAAVSPHGWSLLFQIIKSTATDWDSCLQLSPSLMMEECSVFSTESFFCLSKYGYIVDLSATDMVNFYKIMLKIK